MINYYVNILNSVLLIQKYFNKDNQEVTNSLYIVKMQKHVKICFIKMLQ